MSDWRQVFLGTMSVLTVNRKLVIDLDQTEHLSTQLCIDTYTIPNPSHYLDDIYWVALIRVSCLNRPLQTLWSLRGLPTARQGR